MTHMKSPTLLVVTEQFPVRHWIRKHLNEEFFILDAATEETALSVVRSTALDLIIVDSTLTSSDPLELCGFLRQMTPPTLPILLITGRLKRSYLDAALNAGATDFLSNQLDREELQMRIAAIRHGQLLREKTQEVSGALVQKQGTLSDGYLRGKLLLSEQAVKMIAAAEREGTSVALLIAQVDRYEEIQKRIGETAFSQVFSSLSQRIRTLLTQGELLSPSIKGRFVLLLKNKTDEYVHTLAERLRKAVQIEPFQTGSGSIQLTVSIAISPRVERGADFNKVVECSLKALEKTGAAVGAIISTDEELR